LYLRLVGEAGLSAAGELVGLVLGLVVGLVEGLVLGLVEGEVEGLAEALWEGLALAVFEGSELVAGLVTARVVLVTSRRVLEVAVVVKTKVLLLMLRFD
jgi:hypothetical protein